MIEFFDRVAHRLGGFIVGFFIASPLFDVGLSGYPKLPSASLCMKSRNSSSQRLTSLTGNSVEEAIGTRHRSP